MKLLIACGGTGGHIFPALSVASKLKKISNTDLVFVIDQRARDNLFFCNIFRNAGYKQEVLQIMSPPERLNLHYIKFLLKLVKAIFTSLFIIRRFRPHLVIGFGGCVSLPVVFLAFLFGLPSFIHEQNVIPGRSNLFLARFVDKIAISFKETEKYLKRYKSKLVFTGNPVRDDILKVPRESAFEKFNFSKEMFTILVMGGSQGSHKINEVFIESLTNLEEKLMLKLQVIHLLGKRDYDWAGLRYKRLSIKVRLFDFLEDIGFAYAVCDLVIGRAGASTIAELTTLGLPAILIPYPYAQSHQRHNARLLEREGAAILIEDDKLSAEILKSQIIELMQDTQRLNMLRVNSKRLSNPYADCCLAEEIVLRFNR